MGSYSQSDLEYMFWNGIRNGTIGTVGAKGDPGGLVNGTYLDSVIDLNSLTTDSGIWRNGVAAEAALVRNYPLDNIGGTLVVYVRSVSGPIVTQEFYPTSSVNTARNYWRRVNVNGTWSAWRSYSYNRTDTTAGRAIYQWDEVNNRDQLIYGDTGWRDIPVVTGTVGWIRIRRIGYQVYLQAFDWVPGIASATLCDLPTGFVPSFNSYLTALDANTGIPRGLFASISNLNVNGMNGIVVGNYHGVTASWTTSQAWPAVLPGTANGTIPNL